MKSFVATILILLAIANCQIYLAAGKEEEKFLGKKRENEKK